MWKLLQHLWNDDAGAVVSSELVMVLGIVVGGVTSGLVKLRNNVNRQLDAVSSLPDAVIPTPADIQKMVAVEPPPYAAKTLNQSQAVSYSVSGSHVNVVVNVQYPSRSDIPSP